MKILGNFLLWFFVLLVSVNLILLSYTYIYSEHFKSLSKIIAPVPLLFAKTFYNEVDKHAFWEPTITSENNILNQPVFSAHAAIAYDISTNTLLYAKNIDQKMPIASLTKIMTAIIALENYNINSQVVVTKSAANIGEDSMGLSEGEKISLKNLLYGLILHSGNDASEAIAQGGIFPRADFIHLMNKKAEDLGLTNTRFTNPSGLEGDGNQYSTAKELLILTRYALKNPEFAKIVSTYEHDIPQTSTHKAFTLYNETNLLTTYPGVKGVKTGYTNEAGLCLVTYLDYKNHKIIAILLNSDNRRGEMQDLLDYSLKSEGITPPPHD